LTSLSIDEKGYANPTRRSFEESTEELRKHSWVLTPRAMRTLANLRRARAPQTEAEARAWLLARMRAVAPAVKLFPDCGRCPEQFPDRLTQRAVLNHSECGLDPPERLDSPAWFVPAQKGAGVR
jgi:hypothetical protein